MNTAIWVSGRGRERLLITRPPTPAWRSAWTPRSRSTDIMALLPLLERIGHPWVKVAYDGQP
jgi:hypothetical protein